MHDLPAAIIPVPRHVEPVFSERMWEWARVLVVGASSKPSLSGSFPDPGQRHLHKAVRWGSERWLVSRCVGATRIVTMWENLHERGFWRSVLWSEGYNYLDRASFVKEVS